MNRTSEMIEFVLMYTADIEQAVQDSRVDTGAKDDARGSRGSKRSDPTAVNAIRNAMEVPVVHIVYGAKIAGRREMKRVRHPEKWLKMAHDVRAYYKEHARLKNFFSSRYDECEDWRSACTRLGISKDTYYEMRADVLHTAELYAVYRGAVAPIDCRI